MDKKIKQDSTIDQRLKQEYRKVTNKDTLLNRTTQGTKLFSETALDQNSATSVIEAMTAAHELASEAPKRTKPPRPTADKNANPFLTNSTLATCKKFAAQLCKEIKLSEEISTTTSSV